MTPYLTTHLDHYIHLHADCLPVKGALNTAIYDLTRGDMYLIPTAYLEVLHLFKRHTLRGLLAQTDTDEEKQHLFDFIDYLLENELVVCMPDTSAFPPIPEGWDMPCRIQNAIIDVADEWHNWPSIISQLDELGCQLLQIRGFTPLLTPARVRELLTHCYDTSIQGVELILLYQDSLAHEYAKLVEDEILISRCTVHGAPEDKEELITYGYKKAIAEQVGRSICFTTEVITSEKHCGIINVQNFVTPSVSTYMENKAYNGCLNRKISVDSRGHIRNCPSMPEAYGHIDDIRLSEVLKNPAFTAKEGIHKDQISVCRDCEYRYVCTDCRAYTQNSEDPYSKPLKCGYDPYTGIWEDWEQNQVREKVKAAI